jgi:aryl-alcohol dehydrogenase-like predicted oxidoreductase
MAIMTRPLGGTGAAVTILGYGAMELRGGPRGPEIADEDAGRLLNAVLDGGINLIDTSPSRRGGRFLPTSTKRPRSASRSRKPVNQKLAPANPRPG